MTGPDRISAAWDEDRSFLLAVARRVLGDATEAEDIVQDAFVRLTLQRIEEIQDVRAWLVVVVRRLAVDRLGSAHHRRTRPSDTTALAEQVQEVVPDPADRITLDDEVRHALDVVLDRLTPAQRAPFLLHDVFGVPFNEVAELVGRTSAACRQLASQARKIVRDGGSAVASRPDPVAAEVARRFVLTTKGGDLRALIELLDPSVTGSVTADGRRVGWEEGPFDLAERTLYFLGPRSPWQLAAIPLENDVGIIATRRAEAVFVGRLRLAGDRIREMRGVVLSRTSVD
ncbi:sigma-70 family RNA polymerase sigma factor [Georgenia deserti]|uniref:Sigma-70 family RNA polymerase sigma factor n=1 Tax=Georgenia deserti TaxID=2093781 RepID=A0ABW4KZL8_9MICO